MDNFVYHNCTKILFGKNTTGQVGEEVARIHRKVLLHYGRGHIKKTGLYDRVVRSLKSAGVEMHELPGVQPNPRLKLVREGIKLCRDKGIGCILAVGGGSAIDSAKAIAAGVPYSGDVWDFFSGKAEPKEALPVGVVLTIAAAGSENSTSSVITKEEGWLKRPIDHELIRPRFAILDPETTYSLPAFQTACGVSDIMAHVMERYFTVTKDVDLTDHLCEATLKSVIRNAPLAIADPKNYDARAQIMWAGTVAHNNLLSTGRQPDWATHLIEHEISALYDVPHGAGLAVVYPAWMKYVYRDHLERFMRFALRVWNVEMDVDMPEKTALEGIERCKNFYRSIGLPVTLDEMNVPGDKIDEMAEKAVAFGSLGNIHKLGKKEVRDILELCRGKLAASA
jgi:alcohol dehydrogenase YqhD (iron-dependent ADH family)